MPPKKKKNAPKNAYFFYMMDFKSRRESEGVVFRGGLKDVADAASSSWKGLDPKSKRYYENLAERAKVAGSGGVRYNTQGQTYEEADAVKNEIDRKHHEMIQIIKNTVECGGREALKSRRFYFIHVNHYGSMEDNHFIPCEVAVLAYSVEMGFRPENIFHEFIQNFELPNGYAFKAKMHMEATHKCPLPPQALGTCLIREIIDKIWNLMSKNGDVVNGIPPPLYTVQDCLAEGVDFFTYIHDGYAREVPNPYRVYPLDELFYYMKNFSVKPEGERLFISGVKDTGFPFLTTAADILKGDIYDYAPDLACKFHEEQDVRQHCSRSYVIRWSYMLSDNLCANLDVQIKLLIHTPKGTDLEARRITTQLEQMKLEEHAKREKPVEGCLSPTSGRSQPEAHGRHGETSGLSRKLNDKPFTIVDHSQFQDDDDDSDGSDDDFEPLPTKRTIEDAPLRQPKTPGKSSMMLDAMDAPTTPEVPVVRASYASQLSKDPGTSANQAGRARGRVLYLPSGKIVHNFKD